MRDIVLNINVAFPWKFHLVIQMLLKYSSISPIFNIIIGKLRHAVSVSVWLNIFFYFSLQSIAHRPFRAMSISRRKYRRSSSFPYFLSILLFMYHTFYASKNYFCNCETMTRCLKIWQKSVFPIYFVENTARKIANSFLVIVYEMVQTNVNPLYFS